jgi:hypothetical protein
LIERDGVSTRAARNIRNIGTHEVEAGVRERQGAGVRDEV